MTALAGLSVTQSHTERVGLGPNDTSVTVTMPWWCDPLSPLIVHEAYMSHSAKEYRPT